MTKKESYPVFVFRVLLICLAIVGTVALISCVPSDYEEVEAASADLSTIPAKARPAAEAASVARWQRLGQQYALKAQLALERGTVASAARWQSAAAFYESGENADLARAQSVSNARWQAMGEHYGAGLFCPVPDPDTARWIAMGEAYRKLASTIDQLP